MTLIELIDIGITKRFGVKKVIGSLDEKARSEIKVRLADTHVKKELYI